jgi:Domain of unknown function (DUF397)
MPDAEIGSTWRKSTFSGTGNCVEIREPPEGGVEVRNSKDPDGPRLVFTDKEWSAFTAGVRAGEF